MSSEHEAPTPQPLGGRRVTLGVSGSISAYKSVEAARRLEDAGAIVDVALTPSAARFVPPLTFRSLVQGEVAADLWDPAAPAEQHVAMGRRADAMLVAPASATTIAKLAQGIGDNPVTLTALATSAPLGGSTDSAASGFMLMRDSAKPSGAMRPCTMSASVTVG